MVSHPTWESPEGAAVVLRAARLPPPYPAPPTPTVGTGSERPPSRRYKPHTGLISLIPGPSFFSSYL